MKNTYMPSGNQLLAHFGNDRRKASLALALLWAGIAVFVINNTVLFFVKDESAYFYPRFFMRLITSSLWLASAVIGTGHNRTKRNMLLIPALVFYMIGDAVVFFSIPASAAFYGIGHIFLLGAILETTYMHRYQKIIYALFFPVPFIAMFIYFRGITLTGFFGTVYGLVCIAAMAASLSNRFYRLAGITFMVSDLAGLLRIALLDTKVTYVLTTTVYYASIFLLCASVYNNSRKEVVTWSDLLSIFGKKNREAVRLWLCGSWGMNMILKKRQFYDRHIELAYDSEEQEAFEQWLKDNRYRKAEDTPYHYYSEKYGNLTVYPCRFNPDGSAKLITSGNIELDMDSDYFREARMLRRTVPCIAPASQNVMNEALNPKESRK